MGDMLPYYSLTIATKKLKLGPVMRTKGGVLVTAVGRCSPKSGQLRAGALACPGAGGRAISYRGDSGTLR